MQSIGIARRNIGKTAAQIALDVERDEAHRRALIEDGQTRTSAGYRQASDSVSIVTRRKRYFDAGMRQAVREADTRRAVMSAARLAETRRREGVRRALAALDALLVAVTVKPSDTLDALEARYDALAQTRRETAFVMARLPHDGRPAGIGVSSTVNGQQASKASKRRHVADSFDARPASERGKARPYSKQQLARDIAFGSTRGGECLSVKVSPALLTGSPGFAHLVATERLMRGGGTVIEPQRQSKQRKPRSKPQSSKQTRAAADVALMDRLDVRPAAEQG